MYDWFLRLLGIRAIQEGHIDRWSIYFSNLKTPFQRLVMLMAAAAAAYVVWWYYKREPDYCPLRKRRGLAALRYGGIAVLLLILSGPVLEVFLRGYIKGKVIILVDASKSMSRVDKITRAEDKLVVAHVLGKVPLKETDPRKVDMAAELAISGASRMDLARAMLHNKEIRFLEKLQDKHEVELWTFSRAADMKAVETGGRKLDASVLDNVPPDGMVTEIGGSIRSVLNRLKGQALSAIILITDGGNNKGEEPAVVAQDAPARIYPIGIGVPEARDASVAYLFLESKVFVDDLAPIYVRVRQHGFNGEDAELIVTSNNEEIGRQAVKLRETGEQNEVIRVKPKKPGKYTYKVEIRLLNLASEDSEPGNNFKSREIEVIDQKLNVLLLEAEPRWEFRYLKNSLLRDKRVNCKILLRVPDMAELAKSGSMFLKEFPTRDELFKYHVIVFGNMPNDGFFTEHDIDNLRRFVLEEGGGIWFIAGKNNFPDAYKDSKLELLLPIEFETSPAVTAEDEQQNPITDPFRCVLAPEGRSHSVTRLDMSSAEGSDEQNATLWELMPEMYWYHKATRPKLGATVLLVCGTEKGNVAAQRGGPSPLLLTAQVGRGRVLYQAFADLWRMRYPAELGPDALERLHGHVIQYLGLAKLLGRTARVEINTDKEEYAVGDRIKITARVLTKKDLDYSTADHVTAVATDIENEANQVSVDLTPEPGQRGFFRGETAALTDGKFRITLKEEEDEQAHADYTVRVPQLEMETPELKRELLDNVAKSSVKSAEVRDNKVAMYFADQAGQVVKDLSQAQREIEEKKENTLWDAPILLVLFTLFMGAEWLIRKRNDLL
ncbi:MAG: hypothetical protein NTW87_14815 [Planctomycetota bacterium]|nr:hypothetical protein [Planctomycetota bacterium]